VQRAIAEARAVRPVLVRDVDAAALVLPVDGLDGERLAAFGALARPDKLLLAITAQRAGALGIDTAGPITLALAEAPDLGGILTLAADGTAARIHAWAGAGAVEKSALELMKLARRFPAVLVAPASPATAAAHRLIVVDTAAIAVFRAAMIESLKIVGDAQVPLFNGVSARFLVFNDAAGGEAVAVVIMQPDVARAMPVRMHSACLTGDVFGSRRCDCGDQLRLALDQIAAMGGGIILYLDQEGRGLGLANKVRAYRLQDAGLDTVDANTTLGFDPDEREYGVAARMLQMLGVTRIKLLTNNPAKVSGLARLGIEIVGRLPLVAPMNRENRRYLVTKAKRAGHQIDGVLEALTGTD